MCGQLKEQISLLEENLETQTSKLAASERHVKAKLAASEQVQAACGGGEEAISDAISPLPCDLSIM